LQLAGSGGDGGALRAVKGNWGYGTESLDAGAVAPA
jgi:hypothetical protein